MTSRRQEPDMRERSLEEIENQVWGDAPAVSTRLCPVDHQDGLTGASSAWRGVVDPDHVDEVSAGVIPETRDADELSVTDRPDGDQATSRWNIEYLVDAELGGSSGRTPDPGSGCPARTVERTARAGRDLAAR